MILKEVHVVRFRSLFDARLTCEALTVLVGANGTGKSSFLRAIELFYAPSPRINEDDFYDRDPAQPIEIAITFTDLTEDEKKRFEAYLEGHDLTVIRVFSLSDAKGSGKYYGYSLRNPDFADVRSAQKAAEKKTAYESLRQKPEYALLPKWTKQDDALGELKSWESANPSKCKRERDDGQFFGFTEVAYGYLGQSTRLVFIPAVRDASQDAVDGRGTPITDLMDLVVRSVLEKRAEVRDLRDQTRQKYHEICDPGKLTELGDLEKNLNRTLRTFVVNADVALRWLPLAEIDLPMPKADVRLVEDGYHSAVARTGHGLQRAFVLTLLQHLALAQATARGGLLGDDEEVKPPEPGREEQHPPGLPCLILAIEEPELYQHPNRQRHLAQILAQLSSGTLPGVAAKTQVLYATHSPLFVGIDRFDQIRLLRKLDGPTGKPKFTSVVSTTGESVAEDVWRACDCKDPDGNTVAQFTWASLRPRLHAIMTPWMNEGFFADLALLCEGEDDRAAILGTARAMGHDLESLGVSVIPCNGKSSMDRPAIILKRLGLKRLGIPVYLVWDSDKGTSGAKAIDNHRLLRIVGASVEDWPSIVCSTHSCFAQKLENTIETELGSQQFEHLLATAQRTHGITLKKHALKNAVIIQEIVTAAQSKGPKCATLERIVSEVVALRGKGASGRGVSRTNGCPVG
jgi:putative ATP-dependent endonuclease of the OLD family